MYVRAAVLIAILAAPALIWQLGAEETRAPVSPATQTTFMTGRPIGMAGCAAAGCHGYPDAQSLTASPTASCWRSSFTHWRAIDPHTKAYAALQKPLAARIVENLAKGDPSWKTSQDVRCLACHTNPSLAPEHVNGVSDASLAALRAEGVSCEACHGNAEGWQRQHIRWKSPAERQNSFASTGFAPLFDVGERALMCAGCHVGAPPDPARGYPVRDMNHDMIAAGHPRLNFEFADYQRRLTPHWLETDQAGRDVRDVPGKASQDWLVGQMAAGEATGRLLQDRASRARADHAPWPEFAEYNCAACHHDLVPGGWRTKANGYYSGRKPGSLPWQTRWPARPDQLPWLAADANPVLAGDSLAALARAYADLSRHRPDLTGAENAGGLFAKDLGTLRRQFANEPPDRSMARLRRLLTGPALAPAELERMTWDEAGQVYQAFAAFQRDRTRWIAREGQPRDPEPDAVLAKLRETLLLPRAPQGGVSYNTPPKYAPDEVRGFFERLRGMIPPDEKYEFKDD